LKTHFLLSTERNIIIRVVFVAMLINFSTAHWAQSQNQDRLISKLYSAGEIIKMLEDQHNVTIFYKQEWLGDATFDKQILTEPLNVAVNYLVSSLPLEVVFFDDVLIIMPAGPGISGQATGGQGITVGDPNEYGRFSRATMKGTISDGNTGETLIGAVIVDVATGKGVTTDVHGNYKIELPVGEHRIRISYIGYEDSYHLIRLISDGDLSFDLFGNVSQLEQVTITALRARENVQRTQMSIIRMDTRTLKELPQTFGERDIVRSITLLPGIQTVGEFGSGFNVRGGSADQNLILVENVPLFNSAHLFGLISVINPDMVTDVTLMKAGIPAKFGERASSVMDVRLGDGATLDKIKLTGGIGIINSRLLFQTPIAKDKATLSFGARSSYSDYLLKRIPDEDLRNSNAGFYDFSAHSRIAINKNNFLTLFGYHSFDRFGFTNENQYEYGSSMASVRWNSLPAAGVSHTLIAGWSNYWFQVDDTPENDPFAHFSVFSGIDYRSLKWNLDYDWNDRHTFSIGFNAIGYILEPGEIKPLGQSSFVAQKKIMAEQAYELAVFLSDNIKINERLTIDVGLRFTQFLQTGPARQFIYQDGAPKTNEFITDSILLNKGEIAAAYNGLEPRLGFRYQLSESSSVKGSYNRINQYINLVSNTSVMSPTDLWKLSDHHLKPLGSDQFALGYFRNFRDNTLETSVEIYYKTLQNALEYRSGAEIIMNPAIEQDLVNAKGYNYGMEVYVKKNSGRLTGWSSYTFSSAMRRTETPFPSVQINNNKWFPSNYDRPHNLILNSNYHISRRWRLGATFTYSTGRPVTLPEAAFQVGNNLLIHYSERNKYRLPDYHRLDVSVSLGENHRLNQRGKGFWTFTLMNVYGRKNPYSVFYRKDAAGLGGFRSFSMYQMYIIGTVFPTLTYNFTI
jgi:hypothetical protein